MSKRGSFLLCVSFFMLIHLFSIAQNKSVDSYISSVSWIADYDGDGDYYNRWAVLSVDADLEKDTVDSVSFKLYYKLVDSSTYTLLSTSDLIKLSGTSSDDTYVFDTIKNLDTALYDFKIEVYNKVGALSASDSAAHNYKLEQIGFELAATDIRKAYSLGFYTLNFAQSVDNDLDSYSPYRWLKIDIDSKAKDTSLVYCKVFYKPHTDKEYRLHWQSKLDSVIGYTGSDAFYDTITGLPNGLYDFMVEVYTAKDSLLLSGDSLLSPKLGNVGFESFALDGKTDSLPSVYEMGFIDTAIIDQDKDNWIESGGLYVDVDMPDGFSDSLYLKLYYRPQATGEYKLYKTTDAKRIVGTLMNDAQIITISGLSQGYYQCKLEIYRADNSLVGVIDADNASTLDSIPFELPVSTEKPHIASCSWSKIVDVDGDHFARSQTLVVDANYVGASASVFAKIYYKLSSQNVYSLLGSSASQTIVGDAVSDTITYIVSDLPAGSYDFKIDLYADNATLLDSYQSNEHANLAAVQLEPIKDDQVQSVNVFVASANWSDIVDVDADHFARSRTLLFDPNVSNGSQVLHADIYYKLVSEDVYRLLQQTSSSSVSGVVTTDKVSVLVSNVAQGQYDFKINLLTASNQLVDVFDKTDEATLGAVSFELATDDVLKTKLPQIKSLDWISGVDNDSDKAFQSRTLKLDVDFPDSSATLYVTFSYKISSGSGYLSLSKKLLLTVNGTSSTDAESYTIDNLPDGVYDFKIDVVDRFGQTLITSDSQSLPQLATISFETAANDNVVSASNAFIASASWLSVVDDDGDSFAQSRSLSFDPNIVGGAVSAVAKIYYRPINTLEYNLLGSTGTFQVQGTTTEDLQSFVVSNLPSGIYDFKIDLIVSNVSNDVYDLTDNVVLKAVKFESPQHDLKLQISSLSWTNELDKNKNLFAQSRTLTINTALKKGSAKIYAKVFYKNSSDNSFTLFETSTMQAISSATESLSLTFTDLKHALYDFKVEVYADNNDLLDSCTVINNATLAGQRFETSAEDSRLTELDQNEVIELCLYPNPASDHLFIKTSILEPVLIQIISSSGQIVHQQIIEKQQCIQNVKDLQGVYQVKLISNTETFVRTLVFE